MNVLLRKLLALCRLRQGPQDLPYAPGVARMLVVTVLLMEALLAPRLAVPEAQMLPRIVLSALMLVGPPWLLLKLRAHQERFVQTLIALAGTGVLFTMAVTPLLFVISPEAVALPSPPSPPAPQVVLASLAMMVLAVWKLMVNAHILRQALDWPQPAAVLLALGLFFVEMGLDSWLQQAFV